MDILEIVGYILILCRSMKSLTLHMTHMTSTLRMRNDTFDTIHNIPVCAGSYWNKGLAD